MENKDKRVLEFISQSPYAGKSVYFNFIDETAASSNTTLFSQNKEEVLKKYTDGARLIKISYEICQIRPYSQSAGSMQNVAQMQKVKEFMSWIEEQGKRGNFPCIKEGATVQKMCIKEGANVAVKGAGEANMRYTFPLEIIYLERK